MKECIIAFLCGFLYDLVNIAFLHSVIDKNKWRAAALSMFVGFAAITGFLQSINHEYAKYFLILGYGLGTLVPMWLKERSNGKENQSNPS